MSGADGETDAVEILCPECDYNLHALTSERCPWCGWAIDVDVLIEEARSDPMTRRLSAGLTALFVGGVTLIGLGALVIRARELTLFDAIAVVGVGVGGGGHLVLGTNVLLCGRRFPLRRSLSADLLLIVACLSLVAAPFGAIEVWDVSPTERVVRGVQVNGVFEFGVTAVAYALPGLLLLALRAVSYRPSARSRSTPRDHDMARDVHSVASFSVDTTRSFGRDELTQTWQPVNRASSPAVERLIRESWEAQTALAETAGRSLFNGALVRVSRVAVVDSKLHFDLGPTCFRDLLGTNLLHAAAVAKEDPRYLSNALGISSIVVTSDGFVAIGRRNDAVALHAGHLHLFGGLVDAGDRNERGEYDLFGAAIRELREELIVADAEIAGIVAVGLVRDRTILQPELLFDVNVALTRTDLVARFEPLAVDQEHTGVEFVRDDPDAILPFLRRATPVTPIAVAGLLIHGKNRWGDAWFHEACHVLFGQAPSVEPALARSRDS